MPIILLLILLVLSLFSGKLRREIEMSMRPKHKASAMSPRYWPTKPTPSASRAPMLERTIRVPTFETPYTSYLLRWGIPKADAEFFIRDGGLQISGRSTHRVGDQVVHRIHCADTSLGYATARCVFEFTNAHGLVGWSVSDKALSRESRQMLLDDIREHQRTYYRSADRINGLPTHRTRRLAYTMRVAVVGETGFTISLRRHFIATDEVQP